MIFDKAGLIPDEVLHNDEYFDNFNLKLSENLPGRRSRFSGCNYATLGEHKLQFELRPIRNIVVKQSSPADDDSSMCEVFNRLNTGGFNLRPQELRTSMYHSKFYDMLYQINQDTRWRRILQEGEPDSHMKNIEILLRAFAMLISGNDYKPSMIRFLNSFSRKSEGNSDEKNSYLAKIFDSFLSATGRLSANTFINKRNNRLNIALVEAVFTAACRDPFLTQGLVEREISDRVVKQLSEDKQFSEAALQGTTQTANVQMRLGRALTIISGQG